MSATEERVAAAVLTALNAALTPKQAYDIDDVPETRPNEYVEVMVSRKFGGAARVCGSMGTVSWRIATRVVSQASVSNARLMASFVDAALEGVSLSVGGDATTPISFEGAEDIGPDDGWFSGLSTWTCAV